MSEHRSGFACLVGRPNVGKSTLTNALVGGKVAITSSRPQTTRHAIRGVLRAPDAELVLVDTPGLHRPRTLLGQRLNAVVQGTLKAVDAVVFCVPADAAVGPGDRFIAAELARLDTPAYAVVTKCDLVDRVGVARRLLETNALGDFADVVPVSAQTGYQVDLLADLLLARLPVGPELFPDGEVTDTPEEVLIAELVREAALERVDDELPHSLAAVVEEIVPGAGGGVLQVRVVLYVERASQRPIILGPGGGRLRDIGTEARQAIEALLGSRIYLDVHVKVAKEWQRDPRQLRRLGL